MIHLRIASYNIHRGVGLDRRRDLCRIADVIGEMEADVVGLQEVIAVSGWPQMDQAVFLAERLGMQVVLAPTRVHGDGVYGNAVLTRLPVLSSATCDLSQGTREPRGCLRVDLQAGDRTLHMFNCHLGLSMRERRKQVAALTRFIHDSGGLGGARVLVGDFNEWHPGPVARELRHAFRSPMRRMRRTHPSMFPLFKLDRIYWDVELEGEDFRVHRSRLARLASDHLPVFARVRLRHVTPYVVAGELPPAE